MKRARTGYCILGAIALAAACSNDWDQYDPRLGTGSEHGLWGRDRRGGRQRWYDERWRQRQWRCDERWRQRQRR